MPSRLASSFISTSSHKKVRVTFYMETIKKIFRVIVLALLILLALSGIGIVGAFFTSTRERYLNKKVTIEMVDKKKKERDDVFRQ